ncbi:MAG: DUF3592 domain-containing protein [Panacagrimonas sp.]
MEIALTLGLLVIGLSFSLGPVQVLWNTMRNARTLERGVPATATVVEVIDTGDRYNSNPIVHVHLQVHGADGKTFPGVVTMTASAVKLQTIKAGAEVAVRYVPDSPGRVAIDDRPKLPAAP